MNKSSLIDVSIIIVSWNVRNLLLESIRSIKKYTKGISYEIIVIDNNSKDGSAESVLKEFSDVTVIANKDNKGFGTANNQGVRIAKGKYLVFLNPDTKIFNNIIPSLINHKNEIGAMLIGPEQVNSRNKIGSKSGKTNLKVLFSNIIENTLRLRMPIEKRIFLRGFFPVKVLIGAFWLIKKSDFLKIGLFDEEIFMYTEEFYICEKINSMGGKIILDRNEIYYHYHGASSSQVLTESAFHYFYTLKNIIIKKFKKIFMLK